jgi:hypothetical protein
MSNTGFTCAQIFQRQQRGRTKKLTYVELHLDILKLFAVQFDPGGEKFVTILKHSSSDGMFDETCLEASSDLGNIHTLGKELAYLKRKLKWEDRQVRDEILRWEWTIRQTFLSDLPAFYLGWVPPEHADRMI